jgi:hypothetical protein
MLFRTPNKEKILYLLFVLALSMTFLGYAAKPHSDHIAEDEPECLKGFWESAEESPDQRSLVIEDRGLFRHSFLTPTKSMFLDSGRGHLKPEGKGQVFVDQHLFPLTWRLLDGDRLEISITHTLADKSPQSNVHTYRRRTKPTEADRAPWSWLNHRMRAFKILEGGIEAYAAEHGTFPDPERPESLSPYLSEIPSDPSTGSPLRWVRKTDPQRVVLYGLGADGVDNQGGQGDFAPLMLYGLKAEKRGRGLEADLAEIAGADPPPIFQMRRVLEAQCADSEEMALVHRTGKGDRKETVNVEKTVLLDQTALASASVIKSPLDGTPRIEIVFTDAGKRRFAELTRQNVGRRLAIIIGGKLHCAPIIRMEIPGGRAEVSGSFSEQEARELAKKIVGALNRH